MTTIENKVLRVEINPKGAELTSIKHKQNGIEYMWNGDPAFWPKHSPVLFPIVGALKQETYLFEGKEYRLGRHGFARDYVFAVKDQTEDSVTFHLSDSKETKVDYPFAFSLDIQYTLLENTVAVKYRVLNPGKQPLYFSIGAHPAFALPLVKDTSYEDYYLEFEKTEQSGRWPISADGLIESTTEPVLSNTNKLPLTKDLFARDALVFKDLKSTRLSLRSDKTEHGLDFDFPGFPFMGLWAKKGADFLCIEPWCGIADGVNASRNLTEKEGINKLVPGDEFVRTWVVKFY